MPINAPIRAQEASTSEPPVTLFVAGDVMLGRGAAMDLRQGKTPLQLLGNDSRSADMAFCNLECALTGRTASDSRKPRLFAPLENISYLKEAGFDLVSNANNHALDGGEDGVQSTLKAIDGAGIGGIGISLSDDGNWPAWERTIHGLRIAWVAASAYGPWRAGSARMRNVADTGLVEQVRSLADAGAVVLVSLHWGIEYRETPTAGQVELGHALIDAGASAVIGHHPHVAQPVEVYHGHPIFYSLGNYVFDRDPARKSSGFAALVTIDGPGGVRYRQLPLTPGPAGRKTSERSAPRARSETRSASKSAIPVPQGETVVRSAEGHFLGAAAERQTVVWSRRPRNGCMLRAYVRSGGNWRCIAEGHHPDIFDMQIGDIDHNGHDEIVLGLMQRSKLDVHVAKRLFVYAVDPVGRFRPMWRGSALSRPFRRFWLLPAHGGCDLVALESNTLPEYKDFDWIGIYRWNGFGVRRLWETPVRGQVENLRTGSDHTGTFITFTQSRKGSKRNLILRPKKTSAGEVEFVASVQR